MDWFAPRRMAVGGRRRARRGVAGCGEPLSMKRFAQRFIGAGRVRLRINLSSRPYDTVGYSRAGLVLLSILLAGLIVGDLRYAAAIRGQAADLELAGAAGRMHGQRVEAQGRGAGRGLR